MKKGGNITLDFDPQKMLEGVSQFMYRYHVLIFSVIVLGGLSAATFFLYHTAISAQTAQSTATATAFDQQTMSKIESLDDSSGAGTPLTFPAGRTNPFQE